MISLQPKHLKRYRDTAWLLIKYGRSDLVRQSSLSEVLDGDAVPEGEHAEESHQLAQELAEDLEQRGPTFIKLGQLLSTRPDMIPEPYLSTLARLQDRVEQFPYEEAEQIITTELGKSVPRIFSHFDPQPIASASLSQVYRAHLQDGTAVAVKVQRPGVRERIVNDLDAFDDVAELIDKYTETGRRYGFTRMLELLRKILLGELDFRNEAHNLASMRRNMQQYERIVLPAPVQQWSSGRVLTMHFVEGEKIPNLKPGELEQETGVELAQELFSAYLHQLLADGFFHADPHPGNLLLTPQRRIAILDLGMAVHVPPRRQEHLVKLILSIAEGRGEVAAGVATKIGFPDKGFRKQEFQEQIAHLVSDNVDASLDRMKLGSIVLRIQTIAGENWIRLPEEITMVSKTLLNLDQSLATLDPHFDLNAAVRDQASEIMRFRQTHGFSLGKVYHALLETNEMVSMFPERMNKIMDLLAENQLKVDVNAVDETKLIGGIQKVANRITTGLLLAALIIGASLMMDVPTSLTIFGYPAIAMFFFLVAAFGAMGLIWQIVMRDRFDR